MVIIFRALRRLAQWTVTAASVYLYSCGLSGAMQWFVVRFCGI